MVPAHSSRYQLVEIVSEAILYSNETQDVVYLDPCATAVWFLCDGARTVAEITKLIADAYPEQAESIASQVDATITDLVSRGALAIV